MRFVFLVPGLASLILTGCGESMMSVTPGGAQDMNHTRDLIENGWIPSTADYTTEGLFSEHSLPIDGAPCKQILCPQAATAQIDPVDGTDGRLLVQVGFATNIAEDSFERPALNLAVAIDISGSMGGDKLETSKSALLEVIDQLDPNDQMTLITYGSRARVIHPLTVMDADGRSKMSTSVEGLESKGSTAMEAGLEKAIQKLAPVAGTPGVEDRIFLLTDAQPNVGATGVDSFVQIARDAADQQIGLTVWGVGLDLGAELVAEMSTIRGGNAYHFTDIESMQDRVRDEFDWMVTPIAYDVEITATPEAELAVDRTWGAPLDPSETRVQLGASTLFLSRRDGGMGVTLSWADGSGIAAEDAPEALAALDVSWLPVDASKREEATITVGFAGGQAHADAHAQADELGVFKMAALIDEILALDAGAALCSGILDADTTQRRILDTSERLADRSNQLEDADLMAESELMAKLLENVEGGLENCHDRLD